jgi:apolipoprotein N-acyltransferase
LPTSATLSGAQRRSLLFVEPILRCSMSPVKPTRQSERRPKHGAVEYHLLYTSAMYIIAIAWIYVTLLMAVTETNITAGILTFVLYGLAPLALLLWLLGTPARRRRLRRDAQQPDHVVREDDGADPGADQ